MSKKPKKEPRGLVQKKEQQALSIEAVMNHPTVRELKSQLSTVQQMLASLPEAIGKAVQAAQQSGPPAGANGPLHPVVLPKNVEIRKGKLNLDGAETRTKEDVVAFYLQPTPSFDGAPQRENYDSDVEFERGIKDYQAEWRKKYNCRGCLDPVCPQCGYRQQAKK